MTSVVIRCDASGTIGLGHAGRALALAEELRDRLGVEPRYAGRDDPILRSFLGDRPFAPVVGAGYGTDEVAGLVSAGDVLVSDTYHLDEPALRAFADAGVRHLVVDDFATLARYECDVVVNPNVGAVSTAYRGPRHVLVGPGYALLRRAVRAAAAERSMRSVAERVLICLGGGDWGESAARLVSVVEGALTGRAEVRIVGGGHEPRSALLDALTWADVALVSGGVVKYEVAACGIPAVIVAMVEHQEVVGRAFGETGAADYLGPVETVAPAAVAGAVAGLLENRDHRESLAARARAVVRSDGASRVVDALLGPDGVR